MKTKIIMFVVKNYYKIALGVLGASLFAIGSVLDRESELLTITHAQTMANAADIFELQNKTED